MSGKLKEVRARISSVTSTQQITKAMKMVAAAKLRRAQDRIIAMRPYSEQLGSIMQNLMDSSEQEVDTEFHKQREVKTVLFVVIASNRGLCGGFNSNVIKRTNKEIAKYKNADVTVATVGKKALDYYKRSEYILKGTDMPRRMYELYDNLTFENTAVAAEMIMDAYSSKQFDKVILVYNQFKNAAVQMLTTEQWLPIAPVEAIDTEENEETTGQGDADYIYEPEVDVLIEQLIPKVLKTQFFKALLDSNAAEHGARMTAMDKATDNAKEMLRDLRIAYNRARQAAITTELTEIVSGSAALENG
jgi:F-type H+-transporting ATPase subunit gamma